MIRIAIISGTSRVLAEQFLALLEEGTVTITEGTNATTTTFNITAPSNEFARVLAATSPPNPFQRESRKAQWKQEIAGRPRPKILRK